MKGVPDADTERGTVGTAAEGYDISPKINQRGGNVLGLKEVLHFVTDKSLGDKSQVNLCFCVRKPHFVSLYFH